MSRTRRRAALDRVRLAGDRRDIVNLEEDQVLTVDPVAHEDAAREAPATLGAGLPQQEDGLVII